MSTIINASTTSGLVQTADTSGTLVLQSNGTSAAAVSGSNLQCDSGYGSLATIYGCRAWVNFDGTKNETNTGASTNGANVYIKASGNVSSVYKTSAGVYTVNFTNAMPDANYAPQLTADSGNRHNTTSPTTSSVGVLTFNTAGTAADLTGIFVAVFR